jgi:epoxyqueuosine reductase
MTAMIDTILKFHLQPEDRYIYGFANLRGLLDPKFDGYGFGISIGRKLDDSIIDSITEGPTPEYYDHYRNINTELAEVSLKIQGDLAVNNIEALPIAPTVSTDELESVYFRTLRTDLSHKLVATRAGLGWIGKTDLLITRKFGPRLRLTSILLKENPGNMNRPENKSRCGSCKICVEACPAGAASGRAWNASTDRNEFYDPWKCRNQCAEFGRTKLSADARVCGICVAVCPVGR